MKLTGFENVWFKDCELWQLGVYDLTKIKLGSFSRLQKDRKEMFRKNLKYLLRITK